MSGIVDREEDAVERPSRRAIGTSSTGSSRASTTMATTTKTTAYQTASIVRLTTVSIASPACMILLPMRPAKSFWKKVQLCRITCQWLCQRTRSTRLGTIAWLRTSVSIDEDQRPEQHDGEHQQQGPPCVLRRSAPGGVVASMPTIKPTKIGIIASATEPMATRTKRAANAPRNWCRK